MNTEWFPEACKQTVITRLASLNAALSFLALISDKPAAVTVDEVLALAEHFEGWAWRNLMQDHTTTLLDAPRPVADAHDAPAASAEAPAFLAPPPPSQPEDVPLPAGATPPASKASDKQIGAIFAIGHAKGYSPTQMKTWVKGQFNKSVDELSSQEASKLITRLKAA